MVNQAISNLDDTWDLVVTHQDLAGRALPPTPSAVHVTVDNFMASPDTTTIVEMAAASSEQPARRQRGRGAGPAAEAAPG